MNERVYVLFAAWIAVGVAFYFSHPIGYTVILVGLAATIALAEEDLRDEDRNDAVSSVMGAPEVGPAR